ncbi:MAG: nicotinate (nicotinamide) nucleotide adenylyltransferase [bacterium]|nr:nicotinate (nicotinamide) nucleotide adenylyltransferase [bacterium]
MKTGLFFGSFNPLHVGHLIIAQYILNEANLDKIKFVVSPHNPLKIKDELIAQDLRMEMVKLSIEDNFQFEIETIEFQLPQPSYTIDTLEALMAQYPEEAFYIVMGSDSLANIHLWKAYERILAYPMLIYKRDANFINPFPDRPNIHVYDSPILNISATKIRNMLAHNQSVKYLVRDEIISLLKKEL